MSRDKFNQTWRYLHLQDNRYPDNNDRLWKVRWYLDHLYHRFEEVYKPPEGTYTIDESMVKFKGRLSFRQYMPAKPIKWGLKVWSLCDSSTGYMSRFQVYTGREQGAAPEVGLAHRVVLELIDGLEDGGGITIYMDNFYTSVPLLIELRAQRVNACGTVRANRKDLPKDLLPKNVALQKHEYKVAQLNDLSYGIWKDTKPVLILSNFHIPYSVGEVSRTINARKQQVEAPKSLADYQVNMKGVDLCDQMSGYYQLHHRSKKWWRRLFFYLLAVSVHNAYIVAKACHRESALRKWPHLQDFVEDLAEELIGEIRSSRHAPLAPAPLHAVSVHRVEKIFDPCVQCRYTG
jgi:hypothetical protein